MRYLWCCEARSRSQLGDRACSEIWRTWRRIVRLFLATLRRATRGPPATPALRPPTWCSNVCVDAPRHLGRYVFVRGHQWSLAGHRELLGQLWAMLGPEEFCSSGAFVKLRRTKQGQHATHHPCVIIMRQGASARIHLARIELATFSV